jgi:predicted peroxiredoxin
VTTRARALALVVSTAPERGDFDRMAAVALAARSADVDVSIFFMHEAVVGLASRRADLGRLFEAGCDLAACAQSAHDAGLSERELGIVMGSQDDHAAMVHAADRVVAFT